MFFIVAVVTILISTTCQGQELTTTTRPCPHSCLCDNIERYALCSGKKLVHVPIPLPDGTRVLGLSGNQFQLLKKSTFEGTEVGDTLTSLRIYDNRITDIESGSFAPLPNLQHVWLFGNYISHIRENTFAQLRHLVELDISRNFLTLIDNGAFRGLESLEVLQLWGNRLVRLSPDAFVGMPSLTNLTLGDNKFTEIPTSSFSPLNNLTSLEILNLPIHEIPPNAFRSLRNLQRLHIGTWPLLQSIDDNAFAWLENLDYLSLYNCNLAQIPQKALKHLPHLQHLMLSDNEKVGQLRKDDFSHNVNLEALFLSKMGINSIHESPFRLLTKLKHLDLSQNHISILPNHVFLQLESLVALNLSYNSLKAISSPVFLTLPYLNEVDLTGNPLVCDCEIRWLRFLHEEKIHQNFNLKGKCSDPASFKGIEITHMAAQRFVCQPPSFTEEKTNETLIAKLGQSAWLPCQPSKGVPTPTIEWKFPFPKVGKELFDHQTLANGSLKIISVASKDYGQYHCFARNDHGHAEKTVVLLEKSPPVERKSGSGATAGVLITLTIIVVVIVIAIYVYKRRSKKSLRSGLYDVLGDNESQRISASKAK